MEHVASMLPPGNWKLVWNDEFGGTELDRSKWDFRLYMMQRRHTAWIEGGVTLDGDSHLRLELVRNGNQFASAQLQTGENFLDRPPTDKLQIFKWPVAAFSKPKFLKRYGYFECRCQFQRQPGWWSAFWLQSPKIGSTASPEESGIEVDIMENFSRDGEYSHNMWWGGYGQDVTGAHSGPRKIPEAELTGWHTFGVDWSADGYVFYVDGRESWRYSEHVSHTEQFILLTTECQSYRYNGQPSLELLKAQLPDAFVVDYVRVYDRA